MMDQKYLNVFLIVHAWCINYKHIAFNPLIQAWNIVQYNIHYT